MSKPHCPAGLFAPFFQVLGFEGKSHLIIFGAFWPYGAQRKLTADSPSKHCGTVDFVLANEYT